jgi:hypothetical protein
VAISQQASALLADIATGRQTTTTLTTMPRNDAKTNENEFTHASRLMPHAYFYPNPHALAAFGHKKK